MLHNKACASTLYPLTSLITKKSVDSSLYLSQDMGLLCINWSPVAYPIPFPLSPSHLSLHLSPHHDFLLALFLAPFLFCFYFNFFLFTLFNLILFHYSLIYESDSTTLLTWVRNSVTKESPLLDVRKMLGHLTNMFFHIPKTYLLSLETCDTLFHECNSLLGKLVI